MISEKWDSLYVALSLSAIQEWFIVHWIEYNGNVTISILQITWQTKPPSFIDWPFNRSQLIRIKKLPFGWSRGGGNQKPPSWPLFHQCNLSSSEWKNLTWCNILKKPHSTTCYNLGNPIPRCITSASAHKRSILKSVHIDQPTIA